ncbi:TetR/AcrR family transcriptional regulator [Sphingobacteriaceae bacterium WQ 2009]|uniref:TetR/AcrR family transcriptional regulator n=1 Tax=Rhinopithecimicrobium faecis TaxID=2820698 RepID=A0A8T4HA89_9SPHI|nr:TetR/AcrR family transcriptional regulator [Sphingobacteriaceae bacterium WQ 2009]
MGNADLKKLKILEAATRRFAHFGMAKTTMSEIAKDLSFSKALLYYYFPDKNALYSAVFEYVIDKMVSECEDMLTGTVDYEEAMMFVLDKRIQLINQYYNLFEYTVSIINELPQEIERVFKDCFLKEIELFGSILTIGIKQGQLQVDNVEETSKIFLYSLSGMRMGMLKDMKSIFLPTKEEFDIILQLQKKMCKIFLNGLRKA